MWWSIFALAAILVAILVGGAVYHVRMAPVDPARWHVDPLGAAAPGENGWLVRDGADAASPRLEGSAAKVLARLDEIALAEARTRRIAGSVAAGRVTYETRSALWGFPDYTTVSVVEDDGAAVPVLLARARFGRSDLGVNRARVERWLAALERG